MFVSYFYDSFCVCDVLAFFIILQENSAEENNASKSVV